MPFSRGETESLPLVARRQRHLSSELWHRGLVRPQQPSRISWNTHEHGSIFAARVGGPFWIGERAIRGEAVPGQ